MELLNDELRRQIAARSRELAEKLAMMDDAPDAPAPSLEPGAVVEGRYLVVKRLGAGGMGAVYEAEHTGTRERVAVKLIKSRLLLPGSEAPSRFRRSAS